MLLPTYTTKSKKLTTTKASDLIFGAKENKTLISQAIRVYLSNQRQGTKHAKTRGEVHGTGKKIYRQKGTGRARHGDRLAPIFVKGGVAHGPKGNENYTKKLPRLFRRQALISALSAKTKAKQLFIIENLTGVSKTKALDSALQAALKAHGSPIRSVALIVDTAKNPLMRAARNLDYATPLTVSKLTTYEAVRYTTLVFIKEGLSPLETRLSTK